MGRVVRWRPVRAAPREQRRYCINLERQICTGNAAAFHRIYIKSNIYLVLVRMFYCCDLEQYPMEERAE